MIRSTLLAFLIFFPSPGMGEDSKTQYEAILKEYREATSAWEKSSLNVTPADPAWIQHYKTNPDWTFARRFIEFAEANAKDATAAEASLVVLGMNRSRDESIFPYYLRARELLIRDHLQDEPVMQACLASSIFQSGNMEPYFRELLARSTDREILARACLSLVRNNQSRAGVAARPYFDHPEDHPEYLTTTRLLNERLDPGYIHYFRTADVLALSAENEALLERVVNEFGDIPQAPSWANDEFKARFQGRTLGASAKATLDARRSLAVDKVAPEIAGEDIDGKPMKLSDYRGMVVVLVFWGTWCGPCMRSIPMEKALAERLKDQPFALVGINSDSDREKLKSAIVENGITWRSWFDGGKTGGPIANRWNVHGWPTIIVLDKEGVIRFKNLPHHTPKPLDDAVDSLLAGLKP
jgi:thiol-disulfide isomerase/thioredoxin